MTVVSQLSVWYLVSLITGGNTVLDAIFLRASDISDIFTLGLFVLEMIDFRTIIESAVVLHLILLRASLF